MNANWWVGSMVSFARSLPDMAARRAADLEAAAELGREVRATVVHHADRIRWVTGAAWGDVLWEAQAAVVESVELLDAALRARADRDADVRVPEDHDVWRRAAG
ncbi:hypothetical protein ACWEQ0_16625 [Nocardia thailandica]